MSLYRQTIGKQGEERAVRFLKKKGYKILTQNYKSACGEIDIIARDKEEIVFIEVKTRTNDSFGTPFEAITPTKQRNLTKSALCYLKSNSLTHVSCRFDVVGIIIGREYTNIEVRKNVFL